VTRGSAVTFRGLSAPPQLRRPAGNP